MKQDNNHQSRQKEGLGARLLHACGKFFTRSWHGQPIYRIQAVSFLLVALVPVSILAMHLYKTAWDNAWREVQEKHQLLAQNLASPIHIYIQDHKDMLAELASVITAEVHGQRREWLRQTLHTALGNLKGFKTLAFIGPQGETQVLARRDKAKRLDPLLFKNESCFLKSSQSVVWALSGIKPSPISGKPTLIMSQPVLDTQGKLIGVLLGEMRIDLIESIRANVRFGKMGHSAIVDNLGHTVAHPNPKWMAEMRDLSDWPIVQAMMAGKTGVMEFYSPFMKSMMVAGYASVPDIGWGIMVPQPKPEIEAQVSGLMRAHFIWMGFGLLLALVLAVPLVRWITRPINRLAASADRLLKNRFTGELSEPTMVEPREVVQLHLALNALVKGFQLSQTEVKQLNATLQERVNEATSQLRDANQRLERLALSDHLTSLPNRRYFEEALTSTLHRRKTDQQDLCLILIDIDKFKDINDHYGHAAGDEVIKEVAYLLSSTMRNDDLIARYGGDEFIGQLRCSYKVGLERARHIHELIEQHRFDWQGQSIQVTVSIGLLHHDGVRGGEMIHLLEAVDKAMYSAKQQGRNQVVEISYS
jgi:diguanylate cyclase (GGDEF)-like protein